MKAGGGRVIKHPVGKKNVKKISFGRLSKLIKNFVGWPLLDAHDC